MNVRLLIAFFSIGVILAAVSSAEAQKREMPYKEAEKIISASRRMGYDVANRQTYTEEKRLAAGAEFKPTRKTVTEEIPSKSNRTFTTTWSDDGRKETYEFIYVEGKTYRRTNDGEWETKPTDLSTLVAPSVDADSEPGQTTEQAWFIEEVTENGRKLKVYETRNSYTYIEKRARVTYVATVRTWIRDDGLTIRRVSENTVVGKPHITKGVWEFEYDNIEIKAPIK